MARCRGNPCVVALAERVDTWVYPYRLQRRGSAPIDCNHIGLPRSIATTWVYPDRLQPHWSAPIDAYHCSFIG
ncbi:MAG: hypothetical protein HC865_08535 [Cyanobacteria bacterium RU_5_0]|nr:hypothetical protein [Cyanobacteria bacterium RU_5_0]